jgi:uncharacterized membrane protein
MAAAYRARPRRRWPLVAFGGLWLAFLPNAPYLVTDLMHLGPREMPIWYDVGLLATVAWTGCFLGVTSLHTVQRLTDALYGRLAGWLLVVGAVWLTGLGIYMGRVLRWNSWDLVLAPQTVLADVLVRLRDPLGNLQTYGVTLMFGAFLFVCYLTFVSLQRAPQALAAGDADGESGTARAQTQTLPSGVGRGAEAGHAQDLADLEHRRPAQAVRLGQLAGVGGLVGLAPDPAG